MLKGIFVMVDMIEQNCIAKIENPDLEINLMLFIT